MVLGLWNSAWHETLTDDITGLVIDREYELTPDNCFAREVLRALDWYLFDERACFPMPSNSQKSPEDILDDPPSIEERRSLIERIASSEHFRRSARLRDFLLYVGKQSLRADHLEINEQEIGAKVFGRPASYDRSQDNIVRVNASELRKRLELYFASDGEDEKLVLDIPRGGYKPIFHRRLTEVADNPTSSFQDLPPHDMESAVLIPRRSLTRFVWPGVCLILAILCLALFQQNHAMHKAASFWNGKPASAAFWKDYLGINRQTDIVLPDDSVSVIEDITSQPTNLEDYLSRDYMRRIQADELSADRKADLKQIFRHNLITFGGIRAAQQILDEIPAPYARYLTLTRYYTADLIKRDNIVLIGGKKSNPWDHLFDDRINFVTDYDDVLARPLIRNLHPKAGEQAIYFTSSEPNSFVGYSVIAYLSNPSQVGNAIILAGTDSDATSAAAEFLTSEEQMEKFRQALHTDRFPYFEALLKISRLSGTSFNAELIAYRTYPVRH